MANKIRSTAVGIGAFGLAPFTISIASILAVPIMIRQLGSPIWLSVAVGQAAGEITRAITIWGWNSVGLAVVASMGSDERTRYYLRSIPPRLFLGVICSMGILASSFFIPVASVSAYLLMALSGCILGLSGAWAFIGAREPKLLILVDSLPRALAIGLGAVMLLAVPKVELFGLLTMIGNLVAVAGPMIIFHHRRKKRALEKVTFSFNDLFREIRNGFSAFTIGFVMTARMSLPVILAPALIPKSAEIIALSDKFMRWGNTAMTPIMQYLQTGIPRFPGTNSEKSIRGTKLVLILGVVVAAVASAVTLFGTPLVSHGQIIVPPLVSILVGIILGLVFISSITGNATLVILGKTGTVAKGSVIGFIGMVILILPLSIAFDVEGLVSAYLVAELGILIFQLAILRISIKNPSKKMKHRKEKV